MTNDGKPLEDFKLQWKHWLKYTISRTNQYIYMAQARYKKNYSDCLRKRSEVIKADHFVLLLVEGKTEKAIETIL